MKKIQTIIAILLITAISQAQNWSITGNAGTIGGTNFIGTTDGQALVFKLNSQVSGVLEYNALFANTSLGYQTLPDRKSVV